MQFTRHKPLFTIILVLAIATLALTLILWSGFRPASQPLPDFTQIERVDDLKSSFFDFLTPIVVSENARVGEQRKRLLDIIASDTDGKTLSRSDRKWIVRLATEYELEWPKALPEATLDELKQRVDVVPVELALAQAAKESGWGRSRFAQAGNNLFGHWCYVPGCGLEPSRRNQNAIHEVEAFDSVRESVRRYINNLNTHDAYASLRQTRRAERDAGRVPSALALADELSFYSERREAYVEDIKQMIRFNRGLIEDALSSPDLSNELSDDAINSSSSVSSSE